MVLKITITKITIILAIESASTVRFQPLQMPEQPHDPAKFKIVNRRSPTKNLIIPISIQSFIKPTLIIKKNIPSKALVAFRSNRKYLDRMDREN